MGREQVDHLMVRQGRSEPEDSALGRVRAALSDPDQPIARLPTLAKRLAMSERTLKRRLQAHGTSYSRLVDSARRERAITLLLVPSVTVQRVATSIGYTDPANFARAFRKWTGQTPSNYRRAATAQT